MVLTAEQYGEQLLALLPRGRAWTRSEQSVLRRLAEGLGVELAAVDLRAEQLRDEVDPFRTGALLTDWERVLGLPDPCVERELTLDERRAAVLAKLAARGGQSIAFYKALAAALGFDIEIVEYEPWDCTSACTDPLNSEEWIFVWAVQTPLTNVTYFTCTSACTDPLASWGNDALECALERVKPAHTLLLFEYIPDPEPRHLVIIYIDDAYPMAPWLDVLGWPEGSGPGYDIRFPQTPNFDAGVAAGLRFRNSQNTAVCSPGRACIQNGMHPFRHGLGTVTLPAYDGDLSEFGDPGFAFEVLAAKLAAHNPDVLKGWFGKVHLSNDTESEDGLGFDITLRLGPWDAMHILRANHSQPPYPPGYGPGYYTFRKWVKGQGIVDVIDDYSTRHWFDRAREWVTTQPFHAKRLLVYLPVPAVHSPFHAPPEEAVATEEYLQGTPTAFKYQAAMMEALDHYFGAWWASLPDEFKEECTVVLMADNGPDGVVIESGRDDDGIVYGDTWDELIDDPEKRVKQSVFRGGVLVNHAVWGPRLFAPGTSTDEPVHIVDLHETILRYFDVNDDVPTDGINLLPLLYEGRPVPRHRGIQVAAFFRPNGDHTTILAAAENWSAAENYAIGEEVNHLGVVFEALVASGPAHGGPVEPGSTGSGTEWVTVRFKDLAIEADITGQAGGPDYNGRFRLVRRLGMPDRVWHLWREDGTPVSPWELSGEEIAATDTRLASIISQLVDLLEDYLLSYPGPKECIEIRDENDVRSTLSPVDGKFPVRTSTGVQGWLRAELQDGDIPGTVDLHLTPADGGVLLLAGCIPARNRLPIYDEEGFEGYQLLNEDGEFDLWDEDGTQGALLVGAGGVNVTDETDEAGDLPLA